MKKFLLRIGVVGAVVAPVVTSVACVSKKNVGHIGNNVSPNDKPSVSIQPFTPTSLKEQALAEDDKDSWWTNGISYHALSQVISLIRALAHEYGYDKDLTEISKDGYTKITPKQKYFETKQATFINDESAALNRNDLSKVSLDQVKVLSGFVPHNDKPSLTDYGNPMLYAYNRFGDNKYVNFEFDIQGILYLDNKVASQNGMQTCFNGLFNTGVNSFVLNDGSNASIDLYVASQSSWNDPEHPGSIVQSLQAYSPVKFDGSSDWQPDDSFSTSAAENNNKLIAAREIEMKNMSNIYPTLHDNKPDIWKNKVLPEMHKIIKTLITLFEQSSSIIKVATRDEMLFDQISYLINKATSNKTEEINWTIIDKYLTNLDNGSVHWLALEAFYNGFSNGFSSSSAGDLSFYAISKLGSNIGGWEKDLDLPGLAQQSFSIMNWAYSSSDPGKSIDIASASHQANNAGYWTRLAYNPTKTIQENNDYNTEKF